MPSISKTLDLNELQPFPSKQEQVSIAKFLLSKFLSFKLWLSFKFKPKNYKSVKADKIKNLKLLIENKWWISAIILVKIHFFLKHKTAEKHFSYTSSPFVVKQEAARWVANDMKFFCWPSQYVSVLAWSGHIAYGHIAYMVAGKVLPIHLWHLQSETGYCDAVHSLVVIKKFTFITGWKNFKTSENLHGKENSSKMTANAVRKDAWNRKQWIWVEREKVSISKEKFYSFSPTHWILDRTN